jgi:hypothetical protein
MSWELFQKAYLAADEKTKALIDSDALAGAINTLVSEGLVSETQYTVLLRTYPLVILGVYSGEQFVSELTQHNIQNSTTILQRLQLTVTLDATQNTTTDNSLATDILETEATLKAVPPVRTMAGDMAAQGNTPASNPTYTTPHPVTPDDSHPAAIHYPDHHTPTTNSTHSQEEPVYTSTQEAILRERTTSPLSQAPVTSPDTTPTQPTPPRTLREQQQKTTSDPDELRWGSAN